LVSAIWKDTTIATSDETVIVEGNHYFPPSGVDLSLLEMSPHTSVCPIKGAARFFHVRAGDALNVNAAWTYPAPTPDAEGIRDYIAFWKGVDVALQTGRTTSLIAMRAPTSQLSCPPRASSAAGICPAP